MKRATLMLVALVVCAGTASAGTVYDNFTGYSPFWEPLGNPDTATYGETFTAPLNGDNVLQNFSFYMTNPFTPGDIKLGGYIATWTGTNAGTLVYSSPEVDYANTGDAQLSFNTGGVSLSPGGNYVAFLSVSQYYGQSSGEVQVSSGAPAIPGGNFVYYNNASDFYGLFTSPWDATSLKPDWAFTADFNSGTAAVPEPSSLALLGMATATFGGYFGWRRRKQAGA